MKASRQLFTEQLASHEPALRAISGDALYNVQVHLICDVLDTVDDEAGLLAGHRVASELARRWADAPTRIAEAEEAARAHPLARPELLAERKTG